VEAVRSSTVASGWTLSRIYDAAEDVDVTAPLRDPDDLSRQTAAPLFGHEYAVFLPRERVVKFETVVADQET